jgi:DNA-binding response OmpR family regulator
MEQAHFDGDEICLKDLVIYPGRRCVEKNGCELKLTVKEYDLLAVLVKHRNMVFTRTQLVEKIWGHDYFGDERVVDDLVKRVRKKLQEAGSALEITTVWGYGYRIND